MAVYIRGLQLFGAQESTSDTQAELNIYSVPTEGSEDTILSSFKATQRATLSGRVTANRLTEHPDYPSNERQALADWIMEFERLVDPKGGIGWALDDDERDRTLTVTVNSLSYTIVYGEPYEVRWTIDAVEGEGLAIGSALRVPSTTPRSSETLDGTDLGTITEKRVTRSIEVGTNPIALADTSETVIIPQSGVTREITISGRKAGSTSELRTFDDAMRANTGTEDTIAYKTAMPGTEHNVIAESYDSTFNAGQPNTLDYGVTMWEGLDLTP